MGGEFNPYEQWLGRCPGYCPADYYDLLGLPCGEEDPQRIAQAADRLIAVLQQVDPGKQRGRWQKLLDQVAKARTCLGNPASKAAYDAALRARVNAAANVAGSRRVASDPVPEGTFSPKAPEDCPAAVQTSCGHQFVGDEAGAGVPGAITMPLASQVGESPEPYWKHEHYEHYAALPVASVEPPAIAAQTSCGANVPSAAQLAAAAAIPVAEPIFPPPPTSALPGVRVEDCQPGTTGALDATKPATPWVLVVAAAGLTVLAFLLALRLGYLLVVRQRISGRDMEGMSFAAATTSQAANSGSANDLLATAAEAESQDNGRSYDPMAAQRSDHNHPQDGTQGIAENKPQMDAPDGGLATAIGGERPVLGDTHPMAGGESPRAVGTGTIGQTATPEGASQEGPSAPQGAGQSSPMPVGAAEQPALPEPISPTVEKLLGDVRTSLANQDVETAREQLAQAVAAAASEADRRAIGRVSQLADYLQEFWRVMGQIVAGLQSTEVIAVGDTYVAVVESSAESLTLKAAGEIRTYRLTRIPAPLVVALAEKRFGTDPASKVILGTYLAVEPEADLARARRLWQEAIAAGIDVAGLLDELDRFGRGRPGANRASGAPEQPGASALSADRTVLAQVQQMFQADFERAADADAKFRLAGKLFEQGRSADHPAVLRLAMLQEAARLACEAGRALAACQSIDELGRLQRIDSVAVKTSALKKMANSVRGAELQRELAQAALQTLPQAVRDARAEQVEDLLQVALEAAKNGNNKILLQQAQTAYRQWQAQQRASQNR